MKDLTSAEMHDVNGGGLIDVLVDIAVTLYHALNSDGTPQLG